MLGGDFFVIIKYRRNLAVTYAERWWNSPNPQFRYFDDDDCTNFISQVLWAGGAPMKATGKRDSGWWYFGNGGAGDTWSISWATPHGLYWYLKTSDSYLTAKEVSDVYSLEIGDVIFYDFQSNGRWDHSTVVTAKLPNGEPLVNAHTDYARLRNWTYQDSMAYTENIRYAFFKISNEFIT